MLLLVFRALVLWSILCGAAWARPMQSIPVLNAKVIDNTQTLSFQEISALAEQLTQLERDNHLQAVILLMPTALPESLPAYSFRALNKWNIGEQTEERGLMLVISTNEKLTHVEVTRQLQDTLPDDVSAQLVESTLVPYLRRGEFAKGLEVTLQELNGVLKNPPRANESLSGGLFYITRTPHGTVLANNTGFPTIIVFLVITSFFSVCFALIGDILYALAGMLLIVASLFYFNVLPHITQLSFGLIFVLTAFVFIGATIVRRMINKVVNFFFYGEGHSLVLPLVLYCAIPAIITALVSMYVFLIDGEGPVYCLAASFLLTAMSMLISGWLTVATRSTQEDQSGDTVFTIFPPFSISPSSSDEKSESDSFISGGGGDSAGGGASGDF